MAGGRGVKDFYEVIRLRLMGWGFGAGSGLRGHGVGELEGS